MLRNWDTADAFLERDRLGWTNQRIAGDLGVNPSTVSAWRKQAGPPLEEMTTPPRMPKSMKRDLTSDRFREVLADRLLEVAQHLACMVRDESPEAVYIYLQGLDPIERDMLPIILAALVPTDRPVTELLSWVTWDRADHPAALGPCTDAEGPQQDLPEVEPGKPGPWDDCGSYAAARRHKKKGVPMCKPCRLEYRKRDAAYRRSARAAKRRARPARAAA